MGKLSLRLLCEMHIFMSKLMFCLKSVGVANLTEGVESLSDDKDIINTNAKQQEGYYSVGSRVEKTK